MKLFLICLIFLLTTKIADFQQNVESLVPLNFIDSISLINGHKIYQSSFNSSKNYEILNEFKKHSFESLFTEPFQNLFENIELDYEKFKFKLNISQKCSIQLNQLVWAVKQEKIWALKVLDSWGKPPSGMLNGDFLWLGEFFSCRNITAINGSWIGKYTLISKPLDPSDFFKMNETLPLKYGACFPNFCNQNDVFELITLVINTLPPNISNALPFKPDISFVQFQEEKPLDKEAIIILSLLGTIIMIVLLCSLFDLYKRFRHYVKSKEANSNSTILLNSNEFSDGLNESVLIDSEGAYITNISQDTKLNQILISLSAYTNTKKLFAINTSNDQLKCLDGIRVLSLAWVILGHTYVAVVGFADNIFIAETFMKRFSFLVVSNGFFSVDTFFLLSGLLTSYGFLRVTEKYQNKISFSLMAKYYMHRLWRVTPPYIIAMLISLYLSPYFGSGPIYPPMGWEPTVCRTKWWVNALYINNLYQYEDKMCFGVSWYLANDMQFHWFAPILLLPLALGKITLAVNLSMALLLLCSISIGSTLYYHKGMEAAQFGAAFGDFFEKFYVLPWNRFGPFVIGILTGYLIYLHRKKIRININKGLNLLMWLLSVSLVSLLVFGLYPDAAGHHPLPSGVRIAYQSFCKFVWSICMSFMIYSCVSSNGGFINRILSWPIWAPLSKLTYAAFLNHISFIMYFYATQEHPIHVSDSIMISYFVTNYVFSYIIAYGFYIFFEVPFMGLEKFIFNR